MSTTPSKVQGTDFLPAPPDDDIPKNPIVYKYPWQVTVISKNLLKPPINVEEGDRFLIYYNASGDWTGHTGHITLFNGIEWTFEIPRIGWIVFVEEENAYYEFTNAGWILKKISSNLPSPFSCDKIRYDSVLEVILLNTNNIILK